MVVGSMYCVHRVLITVAIASHSLEGDCLKDLQAGTLLKPFASTPEGPPAPFVLKAACLTISPLISKYIDYGNSSSIGPKSNEPSFAGCGMGCFCFSCVMTSSVNARTPPPVVSFRKRIAELIWPSSTSLAKIVDLSGGSDALSFPIRP